MDKTYTRINWENEPSVATPLGASNLNKIDYAVNEIDNRVITIDTSKAEQSDLLQCVSGIAYDTSTGVFTFTWKNGTSTTVDLNIEKIPVSFSMDANGVITMTTADGTTYTADVSSLIKTHSFTDSNTIDFTVTTDASGNKTVTADIVNGSIDSTKIDPQYMASINLAVSNAQGYANASSDSATLATNKANEASISATNASTSETNASNFATSASTSASTSSENALVSEGYAVGKQSGTDVGSDSAYYHNNAKYYSEQASASASNASTSASNASTSESNASASATNASTSATNASNSATSAGNSATASATSATNSSNSALVSEGFAVGQQGGVDVDSQSPYYENNAKFYSEMALLNKALIAVNPSDTTDLNIWIETDEV